MPQSYHGMNSVTMVWGRTHPAALPSCVRRVAGLAIARLLIRERQGRFSLRLRPRTRMPPLIRFVRSIVRERRNHVLSYQPTLIADGFPVSDLPAVISTIPGEDRCPSGHLRTPSRLVFQSCRVAFPLHNKPILPLGTSLNGDAKRRFEGYANPPVLRSQERTLRR
jgi:hypothetical protein